MPAGRKPKPTEEKRLRGNPGGRPLNADEPQADIYEKVPDPPEWLGAYGKKEWYRAAPILMKMRLLTEADWASFATYCQNFHTMIMASIDIEENGISLKNQRGPVRNPALATLAASTTAIRAFCAEFGMTPSARSRMKFAGVDDDDDLDMFQPVGEDNGSDVE